MTNVVTTAVYHWRPLPIDVPIGTSQDVAWPKAATDQQRRDLIHEIRSELDGRQRRDCCLYTWDRPYRSGTVLDQDPHLGGTAWIARPDPTIPPRCLWAVAEFGHGALSFTDRTIDSGRYSISSNPHPFPAPPILRTDTFGDTLFPRTAVLPLDLLHVAIADYIWTGQRPTTVSWTEIRQGDLPRLDNRW